MKSEDASALINVLRENGDLELPDLSYSHLIASKTAQIMKLTGAAQFYLKEQRILVRGGLNVKRAVAKYVNIILNAVVPADYAESDILRIFVSRNFADSLGQHSLGDLEHSEGVLIVIEKDLYTDHPTTLMVGELAEVEGKAGHWRMAAIVGAGELMRVRYCEDQRQEEVALSRIRRARAIAIFGDDRSRLAAALQIVTEFERESPGALGALHDNPYFQGRRLGVISAELPVNPGVIQRLEKSSSLKQIMRTTDCSIRFYMKPMASAKSTSVACVLAAGGLEERWKGLQSVKVLALGMQHKKHPTLPAALLGDVNKVRIPKDMMSVVVGKRMEGLLDLMKSTSTLILPLRDSKSDKADKDMDRLLDMLPDDIGDTTCEMAVFGERTARLRAEVKIRSLVEKHQPGFSEKETASAAETFSDVAP